MLERDQEIKEKPIGKSEEYLENKENYGNIKNDVKKGSQKVKKENVDAINGGVSSSDIAEENGEDEEKSAISKQPHWEPINLTDFEVQGVKKLITRLRTWDRAINSCPTEVADQQALLDRLEVCY